jgi:hypothetical protein
MMALLACSTVRADDTAAMKTLTAKDWTVPGIKL